MAATQNINNNDTANTADGGFLAAFLCGGMVMTIRFKSKQEIGLYTDMLEEIRGKNRKLIDDGGFDNLPFDVFQARVKEWLVLCKRFREVWGDAKIPHDVRFAWNDGEKYAQLLPLTVFSN